MDNTRSTYPVMTNRREVLIKDEKIIVSELTWHAGLDFLKSIATHASSFMQDGKFQFNIDRLLDLIGRSDELTEKLVTSTTGKGGDWFDTLSFSEVVELLDAALELNLSSELADRAKKIGGRLKNALGINAAVKIAPTPAQQPSSTSSSGKDTTKDV